MEEITITYPIEWESEYRSNGYVSKWIDDFPEMYGDYLYWGKLTNSLSMNPGTLDLFYQYGLMYLLRKDYGIYSLTWFGICQRNLKYKNREKCQRYWVIMKKFMGEKNFINLRKAINEAIYIPNPTVTDPFTGEPDLFCWKPKSSKWFFAEGKKGNESFTKHQPKWFQICQDVTGKKVKIYRLAPKL